MNKKNNLANDIYISETISKLNSCLDELLDLKVKILVPSEDDTLNNYYINCYPQKRFNGKTCGCY